MTAEMGMNTSGEAAGGPSLQGERNTPTQGLASWLTTTDHKRIGILYIGTALGFFVLAILLALVMRLQLIVPNNTLLSPGQYNQVFTMHGTTMVFLFAMPALAGLLNYLVPLMIGARDMAFPRLNAFSYWLMLSGGILLYASFFFGGAPDTGWFSYAPLTSRIYSAHDGVDFWTLSLLALGISSLAGAANAIVTMLRMRAPGMRLRDMPLFAFANFVNSFLILFAIPSLTAALAMLYLDRHYGTSFFDVAGGGDPIIWQHLFWFFGHPEVYILILPVFGILSEVIPVFSRKPLFGRGTMQVMVGVIGFLGFTVWAHHMFSVGMGSVLDKIFAGSTMIIAVPTGVKIFNWLATMWGGSLRFRSPLYFTSGFIAMFVIGGLTGVSLAVVPFDWQVTDSYYIVAHFHNVLFGGTLLGVLGGLHYWYPKATGRMLSERLGKTSFWVIFLGFNLTFMPMYVLGILGMPRRVYTYDAGLGWEPYNLVSSIGGMVIATGIVILMYNFISSLRRGAPAGDDPWDAWTLEWATTSPPPAHNFDTLPPVLGPRPLWDLKNPDRPDWLLSGQAEPASAKTEALAADTRADSRAADADVAADIGAADTGAVETGIGGTGAAGASHHEAPLRSSIPLIAALGVIAVAAGGLGAPVIPALGGVFLLGTLVAWSWQRWGESAHRAGDLRPPGVTGMLLFIGSEAVFFAALFYAYIHLRQRADMWPPAGMPVLEAGLPAVNTLILLTSGLFAHWGFSGLAKRRKLRFTFGTGLAVVLGVLFLSLQGVEWSRAGFGLGDGVYGSVFYTLTGFHGAHVTAGIVLLVLALARARGSWGSDVTSAQLGLAEAGTYYWHFVDVVWIILFLLIYVWPGGSHAM
ncbi:MAG: cytochrome c oxidase subunit I [Thermoleophilia bacterium]